MNLHFKGKSIPQHLKEARSKGAMVAAEVHGLEISGSTSAFVDAAKDSAILACVLTFLPSLSPLSITLCLFAWVLWKTARSAFFGFARLERMHKMMEEERWEITHHRAQERLELQEIYQAKGFEEPLLSQVIDVLMADENRLLEVMLSEELGIPLESYEHPLIQALGACIGSASIALSFWGLSYLCSSSILIGVYSTLFLGLGLVTARIEHVRLLPSFLWNGAALFAILSLPHCIQKLLTLW